MEAALLKYSGGRRGRIPAQRGVHAGAQHRERKRLGDIVVRAERQAGHDVGLEVVRRQQDDRRAVRGAGLLEQRQPRAVRQVDIKDGKVKGRGGKRPARPGAVRSQRAGAFRALQREHQPAAERGVVLDDQNMFHWVHLAPIIAGTGRTEKCAP